MASRLVASDRVELDWDWEVDSDWDSSSSKGQVGVVYIVTVDERFQLSRQVFTSACH